MPLEVYLRMTMKDYDTVDQRRIRFAKQIGVSLHAVRKWLNHQRRINDAMKIRIVEITNGQVTFEDLVRG